MILRLQQVSPHKRGVVTSEDTGVPVPSYGLRVHGTSKISVDALNRVRRACAAIRGCLELSVFGLALYTTGTGAARGIRSIELDAKDGGVVRMVLDSLDGFPVQVSHPVVPRFDR